MGDEILLRPDSGSRALRLYQRAITDATRLAEDLPLTTRRLLPHLCSYLSDVRSVSWKDFVAAVETCLDGGRETDWKDALDKLPGEGKSLKLKSLRVAAGLSTALNRIVTQRER